MMNLDKYQDLMAEFGKVKVPLLKAVLNGPIIMKPRNDGKG